MGPFTQCIHLDFSLITLTAPFFPPGMNRIIGASHRRRTPAPEFPTWKTRLMNIERCTQKMQIQLADCA